MEEMAYDIIFEQSSRTAQVCNAFKIILSVFPELALDTGKAGSHYNSRSISLIPSSVYPLRFVALFLWKKQSQPQSQSWILVHFQENLSWQT